MFFIYEDASLTQEVMKDSNGMYNIKLGSDYGFDGMNGQTVTKQFWIANKTSMPLISVSISEPINDIGTEYSIDNTNWHTDKVELGAMIVDESKTFYIKTTIAPSTTKGRRGFQLKINAKN